MKNFALIFETESKADKQISDKNPIGPSMELYEADLVIRIARCTF